MNLGYLKKQRQLKEMITHDDYLLATPPQFEEETEDEFVDCELCGDAFLIENMQGLILLDNGEPVAYNCVCPECVKLHK